MLSSDSVFYAATATATATTAAAAAAAAAALCYCWFPFFILMLFFLNNTNFFYCWFMCKTHSKKSCQESNNSPAAKKKQWLCLELSQEKKDAHREKDRLSKNAKRHTKTQEECAKCKKTNRDCIMRKRQTETSDQAAKRKKTNCDCIMRTRQTETLDHTAAKMTRIWAWFKQNCAQNPAIREILAKYYRIAPQNRAELAPSLFQNYYYKFPYTWIFWYWFLYVVCLWASLLHQHICWALKY